MSVYLETKDKYSHHTRYPIFRLMLCAIVLFCSLIIFCFVKHNQWFFQNFVCLKQKNIIFQEMLFCLQHNSSSLLFYVFTYCDSLVLKHHSALQLSSLLNMCSRGTLLASLNSSMFFPLLFYRAHPICLESYGICFVTSTSLSLTFIDNVKYMLSYKLRSMVEICKEVWLWDFPMNFSFGCLQNLTSGTCGWMFHHILHCAFIVTDDDINY